MADEPAGGNRPLGAGLPNPRAALLAGLGAIPPGAVQQVPNQFFALQRAGVVQIPAGNFPTADDGQSSSFRSRIRAARLFVKQLSSLQRRTLSRHGWLAVKGSLGGSYRIWRQTKRTLVDEWADGKHIANWCIYFCAPMPEWDVLLGLKLLIEKDEGTFRKTAIRTLTGGVPDWAHTQRMQQQPAHAQWAAIQGQIVHRIDLLLERERNATFWKDCLGHWRDALRGRFG